MKKLPLILFLLTFGALSYYYAAKPDLPFKISFIDNLPAIDELFKKKDASSSEESKDKKKSQHAKKKITKQKAPHGDPVALHLKNKSSISGILIHETPEDVIVYWNGGEVGFSRSEIAQIDYGKKTREKEGLLFAEEDPWKHKNGIVVQLTNLTILDGEISDVKPGKITIRYPLDEGGSIEQDVERAKIENLLFRPVVNKESKKIEETLREQFPKMSVYQDGIFTVVTDSNNIWAEKYQKALRFHATSFYLTYFDLLKTRKLKRQNFVVIFDSRKDFAKYAEVDGAPSWAAGYFDPLDKVLYLPNFLGEEMEDMVYEVLVSRNRELWNQARDWVKDRVNKRYHIFIDGLADEYKIKYVKLCNIAMSFFRSITYLVLRHEATHEMFSSWELQNIVMSRIKYSQEGAAKKKKEYLESEDAEEKEKILKKLMSQREKISEGYDAEAANSWFVEGTATYSETDPLGDVNVTRLYEFQEAKRKDLLLPLEQLTVYRLGSFPGVVSEFMGAAYAESWAFTYFLMNNYREQFMAYLGRMSRETPKEGEDLKWLIEALGKGVKEVEREFFAYMDEFEDVENPDFDIKWWSYQYDEFYFTTH